MRVSVTTVIAATALAAAPFAQSAPVLADRVAVLASQTGPASTTLLASHKLNFRTEIARESSISSGSGGASVLEAHGSTDTSQTPIEELKSRGSIEEILDSISEINAAIDAAKDDPLKKPDGNPIIPFTSFFGVKRAGPNWLGHDSRVGPALRLLQSKLPRRANGVPDLDRLALLAPDQNLAVKYQKLRKRINNASRNTSNVHKEVDPGRLRAMEAAEGALHQASPSASGGLSKAKRKLYNTADDVKRAHAFFESPSLPRTFDGSVNVRRLSQDQQQQLEEARRILHNSKRREQAKARRLTLQSTPGGTVELTEHVSPFDSAFSSSNDGAASASSSTAHHPASTAPPLHVPSTLDAAPQQHTTQASSTSLSPSPPPVPPLVEPLPLTGSAVTPPRSSPLLPWPTSGAPMYSPQRPVPW